MAVPLGTEDVSPEEDLGDAWSSWTAATSEVRCGRPRRLPSHKKWALATLCPISLYSCTLGLGNKAFEEQVDI